MQTEGITYINPQLSTFKKYFETKQNLKSQKSNLSLSNPQLSYDSDALFNSRIIQKQLSKEQKKYGTNENINQNYTSQSDLNRAMNYLKRKYQSINENPTLQLETPQQYERAYQEKMREISDFLNLPQQPQFQTANTAHSTNYINSVMNSNGKGSTSQQLFSSNKNVPNQFQKQQVSEISNQRSKREYEPISAHTSLLTASSFDHQSKLFGYPDYAYNQFKIDMLSQGLSVSKLSKLQFQQIQHQKRVREKNQFKLWRDCRKVRNQQNEDAKSVTVETLVNKSYIYNKEKSKIDQKSMSNLKQSFIEQKSQQLNEIREKSGSRSCNQQVSAQNFRVASKTTESFKRKIMKDDDQKSSNIDTSFQSKSIQRWDKSPIIKKNLYHQHLKKQYKPKLPTRKKENDSVSLNNKQRNYPQPIENQNGKTHAFLTRLQPQLFQNFMDNYKSSNSTSQNNKSDWMQLNISQKAQKNKLKDLQVKVDLKDNQKVKFYQEDKKTHRQKSLKQFENPAMPQAIKNSQSQLKKPVKSKSKYISLTDQESEQTNHKRNRSSHNSILKGKQNKIPVIDQISKKQFSQPFQQMDIITEKLKKFEIDQQKRLKSLQNLDFNKTQVVQSNRAYPFVESLKTNESKTNESKTNESKQNEIKSPSFQNFHQKNISKQISDISYLKEKQNQDHLLKDLCKSRNQMGKKIRRVKNERARRSSGVISKSNTQIQTINQNEEPSQDQQREQPVQNDEDVFSCWEQEKTGDGLIWNESSQMSDLKLDTLVSENLDDNQMGQTVIRVDQLLNYQIISESQVSQNQSLKNQQNQIQIVESPEDVQIQVQDIYELKDIQTQRICMEYVDSQKNGTQDINDNWSQFLKLDGIDFQLQENQNIMREFNKSAKVHSLLLSPRKESNANKSNKKDSKQNKLMSACKAKNIQNNEKPYCSKSSHSSDNQTCSMFEEQNHPEELTVLKQNQISKMSILSSNNNPTVVQKIQDFKKHLFSIQPFNELLPYSDYQLSGRTSQNANSRQNVNLTPKNQEIDQIIMKQINDSARVFQCTPMQSNIIQIETILYENTQNDQQFIQNDIVLQSKFEVTEESDSEPYYEQKSQTNNDNISNISIQKSQNSDLLIINKNEIDQFRKINSAKKNIRNIQLQINTDLNEDSEIFDNEVDLFKQQLHQKRSDLHEPSNCDQETNCNLESQQNQITSLSNNSISMENKPINNNILEQNQVLANEYVFNLLEKIDCILQKRALQLKNYQGSGQISNSEHDRQIKSIHEDYQNYDQIQSYMKKNIINEYRCGPYSDSSQIQNEIQEKQSEFRSPSQNPKKNFVSLNSASSSSYTKYIENNKENKKFKQSKNQYFFKEQNQIIQSSYEGSSSEKLSKSQSHFVNNPRLIEVNSNECLNDQIILLNPQKIVPIYNSEGGDCLKQNQSLQDYLFSPAEQQLNHFQTFQVPDQQEMKKGFNISKYLQNQKSNDSNLRSEQFNGPEFIQFDNPLNEANGSFIQNEQERNGQDYILNLEIMLKQYVLRNPQARLPYQLLFRLVWEAESKILN